MIETEADMKVEFIEDIPELPLAGSSVGPFKKGEKGGFPMPIALFYVCKGSARILR